MPMVDVLKYFGIFVAVSLLLEWFTDRLAFKIAEHMDRVWARRQKEFLEQMGSAEFRLTNLLRYGRKP